jgi:hypothetical protein
MNDKLTVTYKEAFIQGDKYRKYQGRARCPKYLSCEFDDCPHIKPHWRGTQCVRDRRDQCPSCHNLTPDRKIDGVKKE